jgi:hypothetical protein
MTAEQNNAPIPITAEVSAEIDKLTDQGLNYSQARIRLGVVPLERSVVVIDHEPKTLHKTPPDLKEGTILGTWDPHQ